MGSKTFYIIIINDLRVNLLFIYYYIFFSQKRLVNKLKQFILNTRNSGYDD